jgi:hypothetical protein
MADANPTNARLAELLEQLVREVDALRAGQEQLTADARLAAATGR